MSLHNLQINNNWTLFLDRDGVINRRLPGDYVKSPDTFVFLPGVLDAMQVFARFFGRLFVVTNQQGIGKGLMKESDLKVIHDFMLAEIKKSGGRIDQVYFCPELADSGSFMRKPNIGMGLKAKKEFPEINFRNSIMVGDSVSDLRFGKRLKMKTVLIGEEPEIARIHPELADFYFSDLLNFANALQQNNSN
jgi:histidinol-phosphate phosphatase family protein